VLSNATPPPPALAPRCCWPQRPDPGVTRPSHTASAAVPACNAAACSGWPSCTQTL